MTPVDFWSTPVVVAVVAVIAGAITTGVGFALRSLLNGQKGQDIKLQNIEKSIAVRDGIDKVESTHREERMVRIERDLTKVSSDVGALHSRVDEVMGRLAGGNPEVRREP